MRTEINQSLIDWVQWREDNTMEVAFQNGKVVIYEKIPAGIERGLIQAPSPGSYFNSFIRGIFRYTVVTESDLVNVPGDMLKKLQHEYDSTRGLWCIDRNPEAADIEWIRKNAFQLTDTLKDV